MYGVLRGYYRCTCFVAVDHSGDEYVARLELTASALLDVRGFKGLLQLYLLCCCRPLGRRVCTFSRAELDVKGHIKRYDINDTDSTAVHIYRVIVLMFKKNLNASPIYQTGKKCQNV